ncbi:hypothetical protein L6R50_28030 [Myxococcota bacterium]|nr:hypothetical protein [Myxococcota bacterium]
MKTLLDLCTSRTDVLAGHTGVFDIAPGLAPVCAATAPPEYLDPAVFLAHAEPTAGLRIVLHHACLRLSGRDSEAASVLHLGTQYRCGRTHTPNPIGIESGGV